MTLVMIRMAPDGIRIVTDELIGDTGRTSKLKLIPHLSAVIIGSGASTLMDILAHKAFLMRAGDIEDLAEVAPEILREAWVDTLKLHGEDVWRKFSMNPTRPSQVNVLGVAKYGNFACWQFGAPEFTPEPMDYFLTCSPPLAAWPKGVIGDPFETIDEMVDLAVRIVAERDLSSEPYRIGGALWACEITNGAAGPKFTVERVHVFDEDRARAESDGGVI
jgi:hypothetical protein